MRRVIFLLALAGCANGLLATDDDGDASSDGSIGDATSKDAGADVIKPGDAGCPTGTKLCGASCVNTQTDLANCGTCGNACPVPEGGTATCTSGSCDFSCGAETKCGASCVNETNDPQNCGGCGVSCDGGACCSSQCTDTTVDDLNCGSCGVTCDAGATCTSSTCQVATTYKVGNYTAFTMNSAHAPNYLLGSRITLSKAAKLIDFGVISKSSGPHLVMALYTESSGHPGTLVAYSTSTALTNSDQQLAPNTQANLAAGNYWIMGVYDTSASIGFDTSNASIEVDYISFTFGSTLPTTFGTATVYDGQQFNYYLIVQ